MRLAFLRVTTATLLMASAAALPATQASAAVTGPYLDFSPPAIVGAGHNPTDVPVRVVNTGGVDQSSPRLRLTITPVAGSAIRPLASTLVLTYRFGFQYRPLSYEMQGDDLIATTPGLSGVSADGTATFYLRISTKPTTTAPQVDEMVVEVAAEALDSFGATFATDPEPDQIAMVEPRIELIGWPEQFQVGTPAVITATLTNTTPLPYLLLRPALNLYRAGNGPLVVERLDGQQWTQVAGPTSSHFWWYADGYPSLQPGETYTATLRVTFTDDSATGEQGTVQHILYAFYGYPITVGVHPYSVTARG